MNKYKGNNEQGRWLRLWQPWWLTPTIDDRWGTEKGQHVWQRLKMLYFFFFLLLTLFLLNVLELLQRCWTAATTAIPSQSPEWMQAWDTCTSWVPVCSFFFLLLRNYWLLDCVYRTTTRMMNGDLRHITCVSNPCCVFFFFFLLIILLLWVELASMHPTTTTTTLGNSNNNRDSRHLKSLVCFLFLFYFDIFFLIILL